MRSRRLHYIGMLRCDAKGSETALTFLFHASTQCGIRSDVIFCEPFLKCFTRRWVDIAAVQVVTQISTRNITTERTPHTVDEVHLWAPIWLTNTAPGQPQYFNQRTCCHWTPHPLPGPGGIKPFINPGTGGCLFQPHPAAAAAAVGCSALITPPSGPTTNVAVPPPVTPDAVNLPLLQSNHEGLQLKIRKFYRNRI